MTIDPNIIAMAERLKGLSPAERAILCARFALDGKGYRSLDDVGCGLQLSKSQIRELELQALSKLAAS